MEMETDDEDEEDGQFTKDDQEEERERRLLNSSSSKSVPDDVVATQEDLTKVWLTRDKIAKYCMFRWFEDWVKGLWYDTRLFYTLTALPLGTWVRYLIGQEGNQPVYRLCEVQSGYPLLSPKGLEPKYIRSGR